MSLNRFFLIWSHTFWYEMWCTNYPKQSYFSVPCTKSTLQPKLERVHSFNNCSRGFSLVLCLEGMILNNSGGARINISYSIFDVPTNRLKTVSFQLAPLLPTKDWQTHWEKGQVLQSSLAFACCCLFYVSSPNTPALSCPLHFLRCHILAAIVPLASSYPGSSDSVLHQKI